MTTAAGPDLLAQVRAAAPGVRLRFLAEAGTDTADLRRGEIDLEAGLSDPSNPQNHNAPAASSTPAATAAPVAS